jgi:A/G-specific adenine glycosylase
VGYFGIIVPYSRIIANEKIMTQFSSYFTLKLLSWFDKNATLLPWRNADAYGVWLSEIMLQQTQIETVIPYYQRFREHYPTIHDLARAPLDEVLKHWEGLGYYSRARNLHHTSQEISLKLGGSFPQTVEELLKLKGIGRYTAGAISSIAFNQRAPILDGNVIRVFTRLLDIPDDVTQSSTQNTLWQIAEKNLPDERIGDYNQALMQLGQLVCTPKNPKCNICPVAEFCKAYSNTTQSERPVKAKKAPTPHYDVVAGIVRDKQGRLLIAQRPMEGLLGGLWEFAGGKKEADETLPQALHRELKEELAIAVNVGELFTVVKHAFTHFKITLHAFECEYLGAIPPHTEPQAIQAHAWAWVTEQELEKYSFGKADREVIAEMKRRKKMLL